MKLQQKEFLRFIKLLSDNNVLKDVIVVGSWAEFVYAEAGILPGFEANIRTLDIDFLLRNMRRPVPPKSIPSLAKEAGYIVQNDILDGTTKILDKEGLEIEFLINSIGAGTESTLSTNLGVTAQALRHLDIILKNTFAVDYIGFDISVPIPEAYVIHKMAINSSRKGKQEKDRLAIINLFPHLSEERFKTIYQSLSKSEKAEVDSFISNNEKDCVFSSAV